MNHLHQAILVSVMGISGSWTAYISKTRQAFAIYTVQLPDIPITFFLLYKN